MKEIRGWEAWKLEGWEAKPRNFANPARLGKRLQASGNVDAFTE